MTNTPPPSNGDNPVNPSAPGDESASVDEPTPVAETAPEAAPLIEPTSPVEPASPVEPTPLVEPAEPAAAPQPVVPTAETPADASETAGYEEHIDEPRAPEAEPLPEQSTVAEQPVTQPAPPVVQTVYVTPPTPPKRKGNRGYGILFAFLGLIAFALLFVGAMALVLNAMFPGEMVDRVVGFVSSSAFVVPLAVFFVAFVLLVLISNRATWWAYVLGSFLVALVVYFGSIGVILLMANVFGMTPSQASAGFISLATSPAIIVAAILAREVTIWFGAAVASRGRKVTARNVDAQAEYERELDNQPLGFA